MGREGRTKRLRLAAGRGGLIKDDLETPLSVLLPTIGKNPGKTIMGITCGPRRETTGKSNLGKLVHCCCTTPNRFLSLSALSCPPLAKQTNNKRDNREGGFNGDLCPMVVSALSRKEEEVGLCFPSLSVIWRGRTFDLSSSSFHSTDRNVKTIRPPLSLLS